MEGPGALCDGSWVQSHTNQPALRKMTLKLRFRLQHLKGSNLPHH